MTDFFDLCNKVFNMKPWEKHLFRSIMKRETFYELYVDVDETKWSDNTKNYVEFLRSLGSIEGFNCSSYEQKFCGCNNDCERGHLCGTPKRETVFVLKYPDEIKKLV